MVIQSFRRRLSSHSTFQFADLPTKPNKNSQVTNQSRTHQQSTHPEHFVSKMIKYYTRIQINVQFDTLVLIKKHYVNASAKCINHHIEPDRGKCFWPNGDGVKTSWISVNLRRGVRVVKILKVDSRVGSEKEHVSVFMQQIKSWTCDQWTSDRRAGNIQYSTLLQCGKYTFKLLGSHT